MVHQAVIDIFGFHVLRAAYIGVFGVAALVCFLSLFRAEAIDADGIRRGLVGLLLTGGTWAAAHVGRLLVPTPELKVAFYLVGLFVGFAAVLSWLYFCSAYTGRSFHRVPAYRRLALLLLGGVVAIKLSNPVHQLYFTTRVATTPFPHLVIQQGALHWMVTGLAYALSAVGFYMLFELFADIEYDTTVLGFLFLLTGLPVVLDIIGYVRTDFIIELNYEPLGVALFAVGVLYVTETTFLAVPRIGGRQLVDDLDQAVLFLDDDDRLLDMNDAARRQFPGTRDSLDRPLGTALPALSDPVGVDGEVITVDGAGSRGPVYYLVNVTPLTAGDALLGRAVTLTDVTEVERQRQTLRRQNEQMDGFAAAIAHELRNAVAIVDGNVEMMADELRAGEATSSAERLAELSETVDRMGQVVGDLTTLARLSKTVEDPPVVAFRSTVRTTWGRLGDATEGLDLRISGDGRIAVEEARLTELLRNVGRIGQRTGATTVRCALADPTITITLDGTGLEVEDPSAVFEYGSAVPDARTGMLFANIQALARSHGWRVTLDPDDTEGIRLEIADVAVEPAPSAG